MSSVPSDSPDHATLLARAFAGLSPAYFKWVQTRFAQEGVSFARMKLLGALHRMGPQIMSGLSDELGVTARNVTALVDALEKEGLVRRTPHDTDRRATVVELTQAGAEFGCRMASGRLMQSIGEVFRDLTPTEQEQLLHIVTKLQVLLSQRGFPGGCLGDVKAADE
jgi:DNA-binding MarR family transcriptional regulator